MRLLTWVESVAVLPVKAVFLVVAAMMLYQAALSIPWQLHSGRMVVVKG